MLSIYAKLSSLSTECPRERVAAHMQGTVFTSARLKIIPTIKNLDMGHVYTTYGHAQQYKVFHPPTQLRAHFTRQ